MSTTLTDSDSERWEDWESDQDVEDYAVPIKDLFSDVIHPNPSTFKQETANKYNFHLDQIMEQLELNTYNRIRMLNYLRSICQNKSPECNLTDEIIANKTTWLTSDEYLLPVLPNDGLIQYATMLCHGFDSENEWDEDDDEDDDNDNEKQQNNVQEHVQPTVEALQQRIALLERQLDQSRDTFQSYIFDSLESTPSATSNTASLKQPTQNNPQRRRQPKPSLYDLPSSDDDEDEESDCDDEQTPVQSTSTTTASPLTSTATSKINSHAFARDDTAAHVDNDYFASYSSRGIHETMLRDAHRTTTYQKAIEALGPLLKDAVVLDVGCGTGILSMFAARAGAKRVIGVDAADIIDKTAIIVAKNGFSDVISLVKGKVEELTLPVDTVDIIISEWMGYYLVYESMLPSVWFARNKWLRRATTNMSVYEENKRLFLKEKHGITDITSNRAKIVELPPADVLYDDSRDQQLTTLPFAPNTRLLPDIARMYIAGTNCHALRDQMHSFWQNVYGFDMSVLIPPAEAFPTVHVDVFPSDDILTNHPEFYSLDLFHGTTSKLSWQQTVTLTVQEPSSVVDTSVTRCNEHIIDSFLAWFDTPFMSTTTVPEMAKRDPENLPHGIGAKDEPMPDVGSVCLSTSPFCPPTHWQQTLFRLNHVLAVQPGDIITLNIHSTPRKENFRHYDIVLKYSYKSTKGASQQTQSESPIMNTAWAEPDQIYEQKYSLI